MAQALVTEEVTPAAKAARLVPAAPARFSSGLAEVDRVLGGGIVPGSTLLVGGEPGSGKSTLLLQAAARAVAPGGVVYASAEESAEQLGMRAARLGIAGETVDVVTTADIDTILAVGSDASLLIVDSIQTVTAGDVDGGAGGVAQVRECAARAVRFAKERDVATVLVGHVTKDGSIAGPKLLEHVVDVVLSLEGESEAGLRVLRGLKNRYGPTHTAGLFEMTGAGLTEILDPSSALVGGWRGEVEGTVLFPAVAGRRSLLVEIQALVTPAAGPPRRSVTGVEPQRVQQVLATLERHAGLAFGRSDVYVAATGGMRVREPAADAAIALAVVSSLSRRPIGAAVAFGELGLTGEVRPVSHLDARLGEVERFGIPLVLAPARDRPERIEDLLAAAGLTGQLARSEMGVAVAG